MNKSEIDREAEREGQALKRQTWQRKDRRIRIREDYNCEKFEKLFK